MCHAIMYEEVRYLFMSRQLLAYDLFVRGRTVHGNFIAFELCAMLEARTIVAYTLFLE